jgi:hypothetical protein
MRATREVCARTRSATLALCVLLLPVAASSQPPIDVTGVAVISMTGTLVADRRTAQDIGWGGISFGFTGEGVGTTRWFGVAHAELFGGNTFDAKSAIFRVHKVPALIVAGPPDLARQLRELPDSTSVQITGAIDRRTRAMLLATVKPLPAPVR